MQNPPPFIAVDGEGLDRPNGQHDYVLLAASTGEYIEEWNVHGLGSEQCWRWLLDLHEANPDAAIVGFSFGYDVNMMLRDVPRRCLEWINNGGTACMRGQIADYRVTYVPNKHLAISEGSFDDDKKEWTRTRSVIVWDVFGFFQRAFIKALKEWEIASAVDADFLKEMKGKRGKFTTEERARIIEYCLLECRYAVELMDKLAAALWDADIKLSRWEGAGAIASALFTKHNIGAALVRPTHPKVEEAVLSAYYGGRIETFVTGLVNTPVWDYDINSAYPYQLSRLPDLHGEWVFTPQYNERNPYAIWYVRWDTTGEPISPFPFRKQRRIYWPSRGEGWYWADEVRAAIEMYPGKIAVRDGFLFLADNVDTSPFSWVSELYEIRRAYKDAGDQRHIPLKLGLNSGYGKLAQGVSARSKRIPRYQCYPWAGMITAGTRAYILRTVVPYAQHAIAISTDGIFLDCPLEVETSGELGALSVKELEPGLIVVQPGVMITPRAGDPTENDEERDQRLRKGRGINPDNLVYDTVKRAWLRDSFAGSVSLTEHRFIGMGLALAQNRDDWRRWVDIRKTLSFNPHPRKFPGEAYDDLVRLVPSAFPGEVSQPYAPKNMRDVVDPELIEQISRYDQPEYPDGIGI